MLGTVMIPVGRIPLTDKLTRALRAPVRQPLRQLPAHWRRLPVADRARQVHLIVNREVAWRAEQDDDWSPPAVTLSRGWGDCEDFAIAKMALLREAGVPEDDMLIVVGKIPDGQLHAILAVERHLFLDNLQPGLGTALVPMVSLNLRQSFVHGLPRG